MIYVFNIILIVKMNLSILKVCRDEIKNKGLYRGSYRGFKGNTHEEFRAFGQVEHEALGLTASFGYIRTKNGVEYWILPYPVNPVLDVERTVSGQIVSKTYTKEELNNFGFDEPEPLDI